MGEAIAALIVRAGSVRAGDRIVLPSLGVREVVDVSRFDELTGREPGERVSIVYRVVGGGVSYENKATAHGASRFPQEQATLRPLKPDELVAIDRRVDVDLS